MHLDKILLQNFRSFEKEEFGLERAVVVVGGNGAGKSNLLEAMYLLAVGKSFRAEREEEMIRYGAHFASVRGEKGGGQLEVMMTDGTMGTTRKKFEVNGVRKRMIDFVGQMRAVLFGPADMELVTGSPSGRRKYLDFVLAQSDREYRRCLLAYEKGLRQRNRLLDLIREGQASRSQLFFWDRVLIKNGGYIAERREEYLRHLSEISEWGVVAEYDRSSISEVRLKQYELEEVAAGSTLVGPHRDDFVVKTRTGKRDVSKYGSRGEQRMAVLWMKVGEIEYLAAVDQSAEEGRQPILLLDDVFSELDHEHRERVLKLADERQVKGGQVIMTTADEHLVPKGGWHIIRL